MPTTTAIEERRRELWDELFRRANTADLAEAITQSEAECLLDLLRRVRSGPLLPDELFKELGFRTHRVFVEYFTQYVYDDLQRWIEDQEEFEDNPENVRVI